MALGERIWPGTACGYWDSGTGTMAGRERFLAVIVPSHYLRTLTTTESVRWTTA